MNLRAVFKSALGVRGLGYLPERSPDSRDRDFQILSLGSAQLPAAYSLRDAVPDILNQLGTESCVAHAIIQAIRIQQSFRGRPCPLLSRLYLYFDARALSGDELIDGGTYIRSGFKAFTNFGVPEEKYWPFSPLKVNWRPSWQAGRMAAKCFDLEGYYRIWDSGAARLQAIKAAIWAGKPVVGGWRVTRAFTRDAGPALEDLPTANIVGGHAMVIVGYDGDEFIVLSSWGPTWRDQGFVRMTADYVLSASELFVVNL